ncbi:MAG TPA: Hsp20/alpha crystallin family protein [Polyangia bacterium]
MANNLVKRNDRELSHGGGADYRWDPFRTIDALLRWDPFRAEVSPWGGATYSPHFDVKETKDGYVIKADLPGVKDEDLEISMNANMLTIAGKREAERVDEGEQYFAMERSYGSFARSFTLPNGADRENVTADLKNGVLVVHIAKRPEAQPRKITIGKSANKA